MAATPESRSKDAIRKVLELLAAALPRTPSGTHPSGLWWWMVQPGYGQANAPDFIGRINGAFFAIEAKADPAEGGKPPRPGQVRELEAIRLAGTLSNQWVGVIGDEASFGDWCYWIIQRARPLLTNDTCLTHISAVPWRTQAALNQRPAPPVLRIRSKKS